MSVTRELVVSGIYKASVLEDGEWKETGEISVHLNEKGQINMMGPGSSNTATITMSPEHAASFGIGAPVTVTIGPVLQRG